MRANRKRVRVRFKIAVPPPLLAAGSVLDMGATSIERRAVVVKDQPAEASVRRDWEAVGQRWSGVVVDAQEQTLSKAR